jgi:hypothetical protein
MIDLHIEELVLPGFDRPDAWAVGEAVRAHLTEVIHARGLPAVLGTPRGADGPDAGRPTGPRATGPEAVGAHVAATIYGRLSAWGP